MSFADGEPIEDMGPYATRAEAEGDRQGVARFARHGHKRDYVTVDPRDNT